MRWRATAMECVYQAVPAVLVHARGDAQSHVPVPARVVVWEVALPAACMNVIKHVARHVKAIVQVLVKAVANLTVVADVAVDVLAHALIHVQVQPMPYITARNVITHVQILVRLHVKSHVKMAVRQDVVLPVKEHVMLFAKTLVIAIVKVPVTLLVIVHVKPDVKDLVKVAVPVVLAHAKEVVDIIVFLVPEIVWEHVE